MSQQAPAADPAARERTSRIVGRYLDSAREQAERTRHGARVDVAAMRGRLRLQLRPHLMAGAVYAAALITEVAAWITGDRPAVAAATALTGAAAIAAVATVGRRWIPRPRLGWAALCVATAATWLTAASVFGLSVELSALLVAGEYLLAARWWREHRIGHPSTEAEPPVVVESAPVDVDELVRLWEDHVACKSGPLEGAYLTDRAETVTGWSYTIQLVPGKQTIDTARLALPRIASGLRCSPEDLVIEAWAGGDPDNPARDSSLLRLQIVTRSPIKKTVRLTGSRFRDGLISLGPYADGVGEAMWRLYDEDSMWGGYICGSPGSGKSRLLELIGHSAMASSNTVVWFCDPQEGASSPALAEHADWTITDVDQAPVMLDAVERIINYRSKENALAGVTGFTPSPQRPGLLVIIDESHEVFTPDRAAKWAKLARKARKVGVGIIAVSQIFGLEAFGGNDALRSAITAGNTKVLRLTSKVQKTLIPGLVLDPTQLPAIPGYGYDVAIDGHGRTAPFRAAYAAENEIGGLMAATAPFRAELDPVAAAAGGPDYRDRHVSAAEQSERLRAELDELLAHGLPEPAEEPQPAAHDLPGRVIAFPAPLTLADLQPRTRSREVAGIRLTGAQLAVYEAIASGATERADIYNATGYGRSSVTNALQELTTRGLITRLRHGEYQTTEQIPA